MHARTFLTGTAALVLLGGCTATMWGKKNKSREEMRNDAAQCEFDARASAGTYGAGGGYRGGLDPSLISSGTDSGRAIRELNFISMCMRARGYAEVPAR